MAGQCKANAVTTILSVAMMLESFEEPECVEAAGKVRKAVETVMADAANATGDLGGKLSTSEMTRLIVGAL
ncbi:MAG: hypothetical protein FJW36_08555 [Acidobacteria bacterium]|nr:hypothetical protein [Acidobacteriota bacterium]